MDKKQTQKVQTPIKSTYHWRWQLYSSLQCFLNTSSLEWNRDTTKFTTTI